MALPSKVLRVHIGTSWRKSIADTLTNAKREPENSFSFSSGHAFPKAWISQNLSDLFMYRTMRNWKIKVNS